MNPYDDRLATECLLFYMSYVRSLGFVEFKDSEIMLPSVNDARCMIVRLMLRDMSFQRVSRVMRIAQHEKRYMQGRIFQISRGRSELTKALHRALTQAPPFQGVPWPTETTIVYRQSKLNDQPLT